MTPTEKEYTQRINRAMDYIEANLGSALTLDRVAEVACFSKFHFHRIFLARVGETPGQFIQRLRLEKAARFLLAHGERPITDIALDCGFSDSAAFSRAFRGYFGCSATQYRHISNLGMVLGKNGKGESNREQEDPSPMPYPVERSQSTRRSEMPTIQQEPLAAQSVQLVDREETTLAYVRHTGPYFGDEQLFQRLFGTLYRWAGPRDLIKRGVTEEIIIYHDEPETVAPEKLRVSCCMSVPAGTEVSGEVGLMTLPKGRYVEARYHLDATQFGAAWNWVFGVWFPSSGYQPADGLCFERYQDHEPEEQLEGRTGRSFVVDICIPVMPL